MAPFSRRRFVLGVAALVAGCRGRGSHGASPPPPSQNSAVPVPADNPGPANQFGRQPSASVAALEAPPDPGLGGDPFRLGVASGDPLPDRVILWTRLAPSTDPAAGGSMPAQPVRLLWEMTDDQGDFGRLIATGVVVAEPAFAHAMHIDAAGLSPDRWYRYRFRIGGWTSAVGRARTSPPLDSRPAQLTLAVGSCQNWQAGYYGAYPHLVADGPDVVLWCGDYIYERGAGDEGPRQHEGPAATTLEGYRNRYALYRSDPSLQAAHAACPWVVTWDDHEVVDNYASSVDSAGQGGAAFAKRRAAAYRAWWEHMPVRLPPPEGTDLAIHREIRWGKLASLLVLDGRQYRSPQPCEGGLSDLCPARDDVAATMLGAQQEAWLAERFAESAAAGVTWTALVNQVVLAEFVVPTGAGGRSQANMDSWDGYPAARRRLLEAAKRAPVANLVAVTGDLHASMVNDLVLDGVTVGTEFVGPAISSTFPAGRVSAFSLAPLLLPQVRMADARNRGYLLCRLDPARWVTDYRWVRSVSEPTSELESGAPRFAVRAGRPGAAPT